MVLEIVLYTLGIYMIAKSLLVLIFKKPLISLVARLLKNRRSVNKLAILEIILGLILITSGYLVF